MMSVRTSTEKEKKQILTKKISRTQYTYLFVNIQYVLNHFVCVCVLFFVLVKANI
jgi:hypothetical protein